MRQVSYKSYKRVLDKLKQHPDYTVRGRVVLKGHKIVLEHYYYFVPPCIWNDYYYMCDSVKGYDI